MSNTNTARAAKKLTDSQLAFIASDLAAVLIAQGAMARAPKYAQYVAEYLVITAEQARRGGTVSRDLENHVFAA